MNQNNQQPQGNQFNPDQNPFEALMAQQGQAAAPAPAPTTQPMPKQIAEGQEYMGPDELEEGNTGDNTKPLLSAIQALHNYIAMSTDAGDIRLIRNLISALTQLVQRDQQRGDQIAQQQIQQMQAGEEAPVSEA